MRHGRREMLARWSDPMMHLTGRDGGTVHILASAVVAIRPDSGFRGQGEIAGWPASTRVDFIVGRSDSSEFVTETPDEVEAMRAALVDA